MRMWTDGADVSCSRLDGTWNLTNIHLIVTGKSRESVRCMTSVGEAIWCGVANRIYVIDAQTLEVRVGENKRMCWSTLDVHRLETIRCSLATRTFRSAHDLVERRRLAVGSSVEYAATVSRADLSAFARRRRSTLRRKDDRYIGIRTAREMISRSIVLRILATEKAGLYFVHISALTIACRRLWIGTGNGIIISVPLTDSKCYSSSIPRHM